jgi:cell wall-associated NlpC family hydrolase
VAARRRPAGSVDPPRRPLRVAIAVTTLGVSVLLPVVSAPSPALASHHNPSAHQLAASRATVARRQRQLEQAAAALGRAEGRLQRLNTAAEVAFEAYDGARVKLAAAESAAHTAQRVLRAADRQVARSQRQVIRFAREAYESGGISTIDAVLAPGGTRKLVSRVGALSVISRSQHLTVQRLTAARVYQSVVSRQADAVASRAAGAAAAAASAKRAALAAVARQQSLLRSLRGERARLNGLLARARGRANRLQREHLAALARARAAAAAAPASPGGPSPFAGASGSLAGTISASTGLAAVRVAEQQIGKPYVWGGAGPDSFDCSGLVMWSYDQVGVHLDHWTGDQWNEGAHVSRAQLRPGDLVFFAYNTSDPATIHHVGMYIGNGEMVEAPYTGANVRISSAGRPDYIGAVRPYQR